MVIPNCSSLQARAHSFSLSLKASHSSQLKMGPCRSYKRDKNALMYAYYDEEDENVQDLKKKLEVPASNYSPKTEAAKEALRYINPKYRDDDIDKIMQYAVKSDAILNVIFACAKQNGYSANIIW